MVRDYSNIQADSGRGAGEYGRDAPTHKTACVQSNNPFGHSESCLCRASQSVPYQEPDGALIRELLDTYGADDPA